MRIFTVLIIVLAMTGMACDQMGGGGSLETRNDSLSYAVGQDVGKDIKDNLMGQGVEISPQALLAGFKDVTSGDSSQIKLTAEEAQMMNLAFRQMMMQKQMEQQQQQQQQQQQNPNQPTGQLQNPNQPQTNVQIGMAAPDITQSTPDGNALSLSDLQGKVVLVDFWASWCKPCRMENPNVVRVYNKYKDQGFEILGVSLDRSRDAWLQAIQQDNLTWKHVSDLKFWQNAAAQKYGVSAIPYTVLVDRDGTIIAQNLRGNGLEAKLAEIFGES